jgi:WD40 repeat protein
MLDWVAEPLSTSSSMSIFWLAGLVGTGKSTIVKTFCQRVSSDDSFLLASFFASRNSAERRDPYSILHTFAYDLAIASNRVRPHVLSAVRAPQDIMQQQMDEQVEQLLAVPISKSQLRGRRIVLAIDGLDECLKIAGFEGGPLIELLAQALQHQPVKLIISSRQEHSLVSMFDTISHVPLRLHDIGSKIVEADLRRILNAGFAHIRRKRARDLGSDEWPTQSHLNKLVHLTGPFFIYAVTVLKFVGELRFSPKKRLDQVLERASAISFDKSKPFSQIDALYADVLKSVTSDETGRTDDELCRRVGDLLRTVVLLEEPVSVHALVDLMGVSNDAQEVEYDIRALASVLLITPASGTDRSSETVSSFHPSFRDYLVDPQRCSDERFLIRPAENQQDLLSRCLQLLNRQLRYDICGIRNLGLANAEVQDLPARLKQFAPEAVQYACQFWPVHLVACDSLTEVVSAILLDFCKGHTFHWLEVLSLCGELSSADRYLPRVMAWCQVRISLEHLVCHSTISDGYRQGHLTDSLSMRDISMLLMDVHYAVRVYAAPLRSHALHVYQSVLATGPNCRLLEHMPLGQVVAPRLVTPRATDWSSLLQLLQGHTESVTSVACSPDGAYIVSGSWDMTVRVWHARTGQQLAVLEGHSSYVQSVAFSPDGAHVVSGSRNSTIQVWNWRTRQQIAVLEGHGSSVRSVVFSPDGAHIVSGSSDKTVRVWNAVTGRQLVVLEGHSGHVWCVAFSPKEAHIASSSEDKTVRVWDVSKGKQLTVLEGHRQGVQSVAFSCDGVHVVSGSNDYTVRVWHARSGEQLAVMNGHRAWVPSVTFLHDGAHIVSGSYDRTIRVWDTGTGKQVAMLEGHSDWVRSVAFSFDGAHIVSGSDDKTVRVWDAGANKQPAVLEGHSDYVSSVSFSSDGAHIFSGANDNSIQVWDAVTGKQLALLVGHRDRVQSVAFSSDKARIVSGSSDTTVRVWDAQTGQQLAVLEGHSRGVQSVAFSLLGTHIVSGSDDQSVRLWDVVTGRELSVLEGHGDSVRLVAFSLDGEQIISRDIHGRELAWNTGGTVFFINNLRFRFSLTFWQIGAWV